MEDKDKMGSGTEPQQPGQVFGPSQTNNEQVAAPVSEPQQTPEPNPAMPQQIPPEPINTQPPQETVTQPMPAPSFSQSTKKRSFKLPLIIVAAVVFLGMGSAGAYFGIILPNSPDEIWKKSLSNTSKALESVSDEALQMTDTQNQSINGEFRFEESNTNVGGDFDIVTSGQNLKANADVDWQGKDLNAEIRVIKEESSSLPDLYFKVNGLGAINTATGANLPASYIQTFENKWIMIETEDIGIETNESTEYTDEDYQALSDAIVNTLNEYVFSTDPAKRVLEVQEYVGKEDNYGSAAHHYKVKLNNDNSQAFVEKLNTEVKNTKIGKDLLSGSDFSIDEQYDEIFDVWVSDKTKLIQTVRVDAGDDTDGYFDVGQLYSGGDIIPFFVTSELTNSSGTKSNFESKINFNQATKQLDIQVDAKDTKSTGEVTSFVLEAKSSQNQDQVEITAPEGAKDFYELLFGSFESEYQIPDTSTLGVSTIPIIIEPQQGSIISTVNGFVEVIEALLNQQIQPVGE